MIALFSHDDEEMITCKYGNWWETNEQRGRANNSAVLERDSIGEEEFFDLWKRIEASGSGEPGIYWTNNKDWGTNPCCEIGLRPYQFCNLCEVNVSDIQSQEDLNDRVSVASFFGTLQAGFTDFHYLRDIWKQTTQKDALLGIGMTGIGSGEILKYNLEIAANTAKVVNSVISGEIGTSEAARITCIKPSGTTSCVLGTASGIHAWHNPYYLRTVRFNKNEDIAMFLEVNHPELCEDDVLRPKDTLCVRIPIKAPEGSIFRTETAIDTLERVKKFAQEWVKEGHVKGDNTHNVSATISIDKNRMYKDTDYARSKYVGVGGAVIQELNEWEVVGQWMWDNRESYNGLSVLPYFGGSYLQAPFEDITEEEYNKRISTLHSLDLTKVMEIDDNVEFGQVVACASGQCDIS
jgi:ribonucleoside-diphosphate reductase alpha chain